MDLQCRALQLCAECWSTLTCACSFSSEFAQLLVGKDIPSHITGKQIHAASARASRTVFSRSAIALDACLQPGPPAASRHTFAIVHTLAHVNTQRVSLLPTHILPVRSPAQHRAQHTLWPDDSPHAEWTGGADAQHARPGVHTCRCYISLSAGPHAKHKRCSRLAGAIATSSGTSGCCHPGRSTAAAAGAASCSGGAGAACCRGGD